MGSAPAIRIRQAEADDAGAASALLYSAGPEIYDYIFSDAVQTAQDFIAEEFRSGVGLSGHRAVLVAVMPYPTRFRLAVFAARLTRPLARLIPDARVQALLQLVPKTLPPVSRNDDAQVFPALGPRKMRVALMTGCVQKALDTEINDATIRLLTRLGAEVVVPPNMGCCGALPLHMGQENAAKPMARGMVQAVIAAHRAEKLDALVINTSGCGSTV